MQAEPRSTDATQTEQADDSKRASLLGLPREIRDMIYEPVMEEVPNDMVLDDMTMIVSPSAFMQPAICRVNQQLRSETLPLFDHFEFDLAICHLKLAPHRGHWIWKKHPSLLLEGDISWSNFKEWLHLYWQDTDLPKISYYHFMDADTLEKVCEPMFEVVGKMADAGLDWEAVKPMLENMKDISQASREMSDFWDG